MTSKPAPSPRIVFHHLAKRFHAGSQAQQLEARRDVRYRLELQLSLVRGGVMYLTPNWKGDGRRCGRYINTTKNCMPVRSSGDGAPSIFLELVKKVPPDQRICIGNPACTRMKASSSIGHHGDVARQDHLRWPHPRRRYCRPRHGAEKLNVDDVCRCWFWRPAPARPGRL